MNRLTYLRKLIDPPMFIYFYRFSKGNKEMVFGTHEQAKQFAESMDIHYKGEKK